jgi:orotate phosphoribosyltransferase
MIEISNKTEANIAKKLLEIGALLLRPDIPFTWASGIKSPIYCDNRKTLSFPDLRTFIAESFIYKAKALPEFDIVAGVATGGIAHGVLVADRLKKPFIYVRSGKKAHGTGRQVEGAYSKGNTCLVIEDLISTGKSSLEAVEVLREVGLKVVKVISIFSYQLEEAELAFAKHHCPYESLSNYSKLLELALDENLINKNDLAQLNEWRKNPRNWNK